MKCRKRWAMRSVSNRCQRWRYHTARSRVHVLKNGEVCSAYVQMCETNDIKLALITGLLSSSKIIRHEKKTKSMGIMTFFY